MAATSGYQKIFTRLIKGFFYFYQPFEPQNYLGIITRYRFKNFLIDKTLKFVILNNAYIYRFVPQSPKAYLHFRSRGT